MCMDLCQTQNDCQAIKFDTITEDCYLLQGQKIYTPISPVKFEECTVNLVTKPVVVFYIGIEQQGIQFFRITPTLFDLISKAGGFLKGFDKITLLIVTIVCSIKTKTQLLKLILTP